MRAGEMRPRGPSTPTIRPIWFAPDKADYQAWFASADSLGYNYMKALYDSKVPNVPKGNPVKPFDKAFNDKLLLEALKTIK